MQQFWFQSAVWIMSSNIFHTTNTTPVLNIIRTTTTAVFKLQYPPSLKYPQQFFQDILVHNQSISIMNSQEREAFHITLTFLVGLAFLLVAAVVIYFLHLLYRFVVEHQCRCLCTRTQQRELNNSGKTHKNSHPALHTCTLAKKLYRIPISGIYYFFSWPHWKLKCMILISFELNNSLNFPFVFFLNLFAFFSQRMKSPQIWPL